MIKALNDAFNAWLPNALPQEVRDRIDQLDFNRPSESDFDAFGMSRHFLKSGAILPYYLYKNYFRVQVHGIENLPPQGRALLISNHSGTLPIDGVMIVIAVLMAPEQPRQVRSLVDYWAQAVPYVSSFYLRTGQVVGVLENAQRLLESEELLLIFPEGTKGLGKPFTKRYQVQDFTVGFIELAIRYNAPIIPMAVIGAEEQYLNFGNLQDMAKKLNMPYLPLTPTFPLLGPLGLIPYPSQYHIHFGEPINLAGKGIDEKILDDPDAMREKAGLVRNTVQQMIEKGLEDRKARTREEGRE